MPGCSSKENTKRCLCIKPQTAALPGEVRVDVDKVLRLTKSPVQGGTSTVSKWYWPMFRKKNESALTILKYIYGIEVIEGRLVESRELTDEEELFMSTLPLPSRVKEGPRKGSLQNGAPAAGMIIYIYIYIYI